jgi:DNA polymerase-3 subunit beta
MKFTVSSTDLQRALTTVNGAVPTKSALPILECVLFERPDGAADALTVSATDLELSIMQRLPVQFESNGTDARHRVAVPARRLLDTLRALPDLPVTISTDAEFNVELTTDQGRYKMVGFDGGDYPALPAMDSATVVETTSALIKRSIEKTGFAASKDALRPAMMGVLFQIRPDGTTAVATDGHRLVKLGLSQITSDASIDVIVPEKALAQAAKAAGDGPCRLLIGTGNVGFDYGETKVVARLIDETYPNYEAVIPVENEKRLVVGREALLAAVRRVALYSSSMTHQIRLALGADALDVSAEDIERASEAKERVLCDYNAEPMEIGFNSVYLQEVLQNVDGDDAVFEFSSPNRAGVVTPAVPQEGEALQMLIMPVMLNTYA